MATEQAAVCHGERGEGDGSRRQAEGRSSHSCTLTGNEWRSGEWVGPGCREQAEDSSQIGHLLLGHRPGCRAPSPSTPPSPFWWFPGGGVAARGTGICLALVTRFSDWGSVSTTAGGREPASHSLPFGPGS